MIEHLTKVKNILMIPKAYLRDKKNNTKVVRDIVLFLTWSSSPSSIAKEKGNSSSTTSVTAAAPI
jgi:hypothetical protein